MVRQFQDRTVRAAAFISGVLLVSYTFSPEIAAASATIATPFSHAAWRAGETTTQKIYE